MERDGTLLLALKRSIRKGSLVIKELIKGQGEEGSLEGLCLEIDKGPTVKTKVKAKKGKGKATRKDLKAASKSYPLF